MRRVFALIVGLAFAAVAVGAAQDPPAFVSASSELVVLPVVVTSRDGQVVADLPRDRFTVYDDGRRQEITLFSNGDTPVTIGVVIDDSRSMRPKLDEVRTAAVAFARSSNPHDELFTVDFNDVVRDSPAGGSGFISGAGQLEAQLRSLVPQGRTALYDALMTALAHVERGTRPRKVLIVISDGGDNASGSTLAAVLARARRSNVTIYTIGLFDQDDLDRDPNVLKTLARETGGERFLPQSANPLLTACEHIAREIRSGYTIGFEPPDRDGRYHRVRVEVTPAARGRQVTVRTRPGYFAAGGAASHP